MAAIGSVFTLYMRRLVNSSALQFWKWQADWRKLVVPRRCMQLSIDNPRCIATDILLILSAALGLQALHPVARTLTTH